MVRPTKTRSKPRALRVEPLEAKNLLTGDTLVISEFMASNDATILDSFNETPDWIELHNDSGQPIDLLGWNLTDEANQRPRWSFDVSTIVPPQGRIVVFASGRDTVTTDGEHHTDFKLQSDGEFLALINPAGEIVSQFGGGTTEYPRTPTDVSLGIDSNGRQRHFLNPTPGELNDESSGGLVSDTRFSVDRGFFSSSFRLTVQSTTVGATLAYTLDGSEPSPTNGVQITSSFTGPSTTLTIDSTSTLRAMAYLDGWTSTNVDTQTYFFLDQVIQQDGEGLPNTWGHAGADYEMDPNVVNSPLYRDEIVDSLKAIPTVSLVTDIDNWFAAGGQGIYPSGKGSPRPVSVEMLFPETNDDVQVEASVEIQGGSSTNRWKSDKLSMQLKFKEEFGDAKLDYPLFGEEATDSFDTLILDARLNQAWSYGGGVTPEDQRRRAQYTRDQYVANLQRELGGTAPHGQWVHLYLNGIYWGMYNLHERPDEHFAQDYLGGEKTDYNIVKHNDDVVHGSFDGYRDLLDAIDQNVAQESEYRAVEEMLDVDDFIHYMLVNYFVGNTDWGHQNWYASMNEASGDGKWRYHSWDAEVVLKSLSDNPTTRADRFGPTKVHHRLMLNPEYKLKFMDAVQATMFDDGMLTPQNATAAYQQSLDIVYEAVIAESARWGDNQRSGQAFTRDVEWVAERDRLLEEYFPQRTDAVIEDFRNANFFHDYDAPSFNQHGGEVDGAFQITISSGGTVFYTLDGTDPRLSDSAIEYTDGIVLNASATIQTRALRGTDEWSALTVAQFQTVGDFSGDGTLNAADLDLLINAVADDSNDSRFDVDRNNSINSDDLDYWLSELANTRRGDANLDGTVNFADFLILSTNFGQIDRGWGDSNFDDDASVSFADFLVLASNFGWMREA